MSFSHSWTIIGCQHSLKVIEFSPDVTTVLITRLVKTLLLVNENWTANYNNK